MTLKKYYFYRLLIVMVLSFIFSASLVAKNYIIPILAVVICILLIIMMKKNVKEVLADERDYELAGKSSRYAMTAYSFMAVCIMFFLLAFREANAQYEMAAMILAYSVCALMIFNSVIFKYLQQDTTEKRKKVIWIVIFLILGIFLIIFNLRFFGGEDDWMCQNGQWVKHGNPDSAMPTKECLK